MSMVLKLFSGVDAVPENAWGELETAEENLFLDFDFLKVQESILLQRGLKLHYVLVSDAGKACALLVFQEYGLSLRDLFSGLSADGSKFKSWFYRAFQFLIDRPLVKILVCGDVLSTAISGVRFVPGLSQDKQRSSIQKALSFMTQACKSRLGLLLVKDLQCAYSNMMAVDSRELDLPPTMMLDLMPGWHSLEDYKRDLKSKYRAGVKRVLESAQAIKRRHLTAAEIRLCSSKIDTLYSDIYLRAKAKGPYLGWEYFYQLRQALNPKQYQVIGYFSEENLIGFNTRYFVNGIVESTFFGVKQEEKEKYQLLKCMLLDDLAYAIEQGADKLHLGRTNYDMKSALGAEPVQCPSFYRPLNNYSRPLAYLMRNITRAEIWTPRSPFRKTGLIQKLECDNSSKAPDLGNLLVHGEQ